MGFFQKLLGRDDDPFVTRGSTVVIRKAEIAARLRAPEEPNFGDAPQPPCERCGKPVDEVLITTFGPAGDPAVWREHPVAVDGWACPSCGVFRYPRRIAPARIHALTEKGAEHARAGRLDDAEACFTRIVWDWPGYFVGHMNLAEAARDRLFVEKDAPEPVRRRLVDRMVAQYEAALAAHDESPDPRLARALGRARLSLAEIALERRSFDRATRLLEACLATESADPNDLDRARDLARYVAERRDLFDGAAAALEPYLALSDRPQKPIETGADRKKVVEALEKLEEHLAVAPPAWQSAWLYAKGKAALGNWPETRAAWERAYEAHPDAKGIARDYSHDLLRHGENDRARVVARAIAEAHPDDATLWCNLAVTELLSGDLDRSEICLKKSLALDANDRIAHLVDKKLASIRAGAPQPRTLADLERA
jgi:tetratricopeptide (TPR) repeat protein